MDYLTQLDNQMDELRDDLDLALEKMKRIQDKLEDDWWDDNQYAAKKHLIDMQYATNAALNLVNKSIRKGITFKRNIKKGK
jgi:hypothetical protein